MSKKKKKNALHYYVYEFSVYDKITKCQNCPIYSCEHGCRLWGDFSVTREKNCPLSLIKKEKVGFPDE